MMPTNTDHQTGKGNKLSTYRIVKDEISHPLNWLPFDYHSVQKRFLFVFWKTLVSDLSEKEAKTLVSNLKYLSKKR